MWRLKTQVFKIVALGFITALVICEWLIFEIAVLPCAFPHLSNTSDHGEVLHAMMVADLHLVGEYRGHWLDRVKRDSQMRASFSALLRHVRPDIVFVLGDLLDEGKWNWYSDLPFHRARDRYRRYFNSSGVEVRPVTGNHDIGFHYDMDWIKVERFEKGFSTDKVQFISRKGVHFVLLNSITLKNDSCPACEQTMKQLRDLRKTLNCLGKSTASCRDILQRRGIDPALNYSAPIILQHFPLYRQNESQCLNSPNFDINKELEQDWDVLSKRVSSNLIKILKPRLAVSGHSHYYCEYPHEKDVLEVTISSFSWRHEPSPHVLLLSISNDEFQFTTCNLPNEFFQIFLYICIASVTWYIGYLRQSDKSSPVTFSFTAALSSVIGVVSLKKTHVKNSTWTM